MNIWRVNCDWEFRSSSTDTGPYVREHPGETFLVATVGDSLEEVKTAIRDGLGSQCYLNRLNSAEWIGVPMNWEQWERRTFCDEYATVMAVAENFDAQDSE